MQHLEETLSTLESNLEFSNASARYLVVEGVFFNSGDIAPLPALITQKIAHKMRLIVDEQLSFGTIGATGKGITEYFNRKVTEVDVLMGSLETSLGAMGGFCVGSDPDKYHQILNSASYCFSASSPPYLCAAASKGLELLAENGAFLAERLHNNTKLLRTKLAEKLPKGARVLGHEDSPVIILQLANEELPADTARSMMQQVADCAWSAGVAIVAVAE